MRRKSGEELDTILYFLSNALNSVIEDNGYLAHHRAAVPRISAGLATAEIASRLAMFREQVCDASEREHMVLTKLARARHWAQELRRHEPHLRADIDTFLSITARCEDLMREAGPDPQSLFDGDAQPKRFLAERLPGGRAVAETALSLMERLSAAESGEPVSDDAGPGYLIGGELSVDELNDACERLLTRLSVHYGWADEAPVEDDEDEWADDPASSEVSGECEETASHGRTAEAEAAGADAAGEPPDTAEASEPPETGTVHTQSEESGTTAQAAAEAPEEPLGTPAQSVDQDEGDAGADADPFARDDGETDATRRADADSQSGSGPDDREGAGFCRREDSEGADCQRPQESPAAGHG